MRIRIGNSEKVKIGVLAAFSILSIILGGFVFSVDQCTIIIKHFGLFLIFSSFIVFVWLSIKFILTNKVQFPKKYSRSQIFILLFILLTSVFIYSREPTEYKIIADEIILVGVSQSMYFNGTVVVPSKANSNTGVFLIEKAYVDKRPFFYPFLVYIIHLLTGYRAENGFLLNILLTPVLLSLIYFTTYRISNRMGGILSILLVVSWPLVAQNCNGAHFEVLNLIMILGTLHLGIQFSGKPTSLSLALFCYSALLLSQCRYESVLYVFPVAFIVLSVWLREKGHLTIPWSIVFIPVLLICVPMQFRIYQANPQFWQPEVLQDRVPFGITHLWSNIESAFTYLLSINYEQSNSYLLSLLVIASLFFIPFIIINRDKIDKDKQSILNIFFIFVLLTLATFILVLFYFWGQLDDSVASRFSLPLCILITCLIPWILKKFGSKFVFAVFLLHLIFIFLNTVNLPIINYLYAIMRHYGIIFVAGLFLYIFVYKYKHKLITYLLICSTVFIVFVTIPICANKFYLQRYWPATETAMIQQFIDNQTDNNYFLSSKTALLSIINKVPSASIDVINRNLSTLKLHLLHQNYDALYVYQSGAIDYETNSFVPFEDWIISESIILETVKQKKLSQQAVGRISRIVDVIGVSESEISERISPITESTQQDSIQDAP